MEFISTQKHLRVSPRKMRELIFLAKGLTPSRALEILPHVEKKNAVVLFKAIKTSIANAVSKGFSESDLVFKEIQVNEGTRLKRYRPGSRGRAMPYIKRLSHLRIILTTKNKEETKVKDQKVKTEKKGSAVAKAMADKNK